jgi:hypothetical protein
MGEVIRLGLTTVFELTLIHIAQRKYSSDLILPRPHLTQVCGLFPHQHSVAIYIGLCTTVSLNFDTIYVTYAESLRESEAAQGCRHLIDLGR